MTAHFEWDPGEEGEPAPSAVVLEKHASAGWKGATGTADTTLEPSSSSLESPRGATFTGGPEYEFRGGGSFNGAEFDVAISPSSSGSTTYGNPYGVGLVAASIGIKVIAHPVRIEFSNVQMVEGSAKTIVGKRITATLSVDGYAGETGDTFAWEVDEAGMPFDHWNIASDQSSSSLDSEFTDDEESVTCCFAKDDSDVDYSCSALLAGWGVSVSVSRSLIVDRPIVTHFDYLGNMVFRDDDTATGATKLILRHSNTQYTGNFGAVFQGHVNTPSDLPEGGTITIVSTFTNSLSSRDDPARNVSLNDNDYLDVAYYIDNSSPLQYRFGEKTVGLEGASNGQVFFFADAPGIGITPGSTKSITDYATFDTFLMYRPSGLGSEWVPVWKWDWHHSGADTRGTTSTDWGSPTTDDCDLDGSAVCPDHPIWEHRYTTGREQ